MSIDLFVGLLGVIVPLINTSLITWLVWAHLKEADRHAELDERFRKIERDLKKEGEP